MKYNQNQDFANQHRHIYFVKRERVKIKVTNIIWNIFPYALNEIVAFETHCFLIHISFYLLRSYTEAVFLKFGEWLQNWCCIWVIPNTTKCNFHDTIQYQMFCVPYRNGATLGDDPLISSRLMFLCKRWQHSTEARSTRNHKLEVNISIIYDFKKSALAYR